MTLPTSFLTSVTLLLSLGCTFASHSNEVLIPLLLGQPKLYSFDVPAYLNASPVKSSPLVTFSNVTFQEFDRDVTFKLLQIPSFDDVYEWYSESLETHPFTTKSITAAIIGATGDVLAQYVEAWTMGKSYRWAMLDRRRTFSLGVEGFFISGPFMHMGYELLEHYFPVFAESEEETDGAFYTWFMVICQVLIDALIMDSFFVATTILSSGVLEGRGYGIFEELKESYIPSCKASYISSVIWSPVQLLSFKYVPLPFRVAAINLQDIAWFATISFMAHRCRHDDKKAPEKGEGEQQQDKDKSA